LNSTTEAGAGTYHRVGKSLDIELLLRFSLYTGGNIVATLILNVTYASGPNERFGFQHLQTSFAMVWDVGPIFFPIASGELPGTTCGLIANSPTWNALAKPKTPSHGQLP